jgi:hypothetical protein
MTTTAEQPPYRMTLDLNILNHLGIHLYSNVPAVVSEAVSNAWDAEATEVEIILEPGKDRIEINDNGWGMDASDINNKYLKIGYQKRKHEKSVTPNLKRHVMGRKGIGKLSLFSIAERIEIHSVKGSQKNGLVLSGPDIEEQISAGHAHYVPTVVPASKIKITKGTKIVLTKLKKKLTLAVPGLRKRLARRFSVIGAEYKFKVLVNGNPIAVEDRDFFKSIQFLWTIGDGSAKYADLCPNHEKKLHLDGTVDAKKGYKISGWIGAVESHKQIEGNNAIVLLAWGKLAQEDILADYKEGGLYSKYLIGEINADFLDLDDEDDIATSNRQKVFEDDPRYKALREHVYSLLKEIQNVWTEWRRDVSAKKALVNPVIKQWYESLSSSSKKHAKVLFDKIESLPMNKEEDKRELYKFGILAFERLKVRESLDALSSAAASDLKFSAIFNELEDIEAVLYYDIATERVKIIKTFAKVVDKNQKEKIVQKYLFDNLWLLHPSWERAAKNMRIEESVTTEFQKVTATLTSKERAARLDIRYKTAAGKHIIIELKRANRAVTTLELVEQVKKYQDALRKCLKAAGKEGEPIEVICLLGQPLAEDKDFIKKQLESVNARVILYEQLIQESLDSYKDYLEKQEQLAGLRKLIDRL